VVLVIYLYGVLSTLLFNGDRCPKISRIFSIPDGLMIESCSLNDELTNSQGGYNNNYSKFGIQK
jgi:hypothetical protein